MGSSIMKFLNSLRGKGKTSLIIVAFILSIGMLIGLPFLLVMALRLLGAKIGYTFYTWVGALIILVLFNSVGSGKPSD